MRGRRNRHSQAGNHWGAWCTRTAPFIRPGAKVVPGSDKLAVEAVARTKGGVHESECDDACHDTMRVYVYLFISRWNDAIRSESTVACNDGNVDSGAWRDLRCNLYLIISLWNRSMNSTYWNHSRRSGLKLAKDEASTTLFKEETGR